MKKSNEYHVLPLVLLLPAPTVGALAALWWWPETPLGQGIYAAMKVWLLALPLTWHVLVERKPIRINKPEWPGLAMGVTTGLIIAGVIFGGYHFIGRHWIDAEAMRQAAAARGFDAVGLYIGFALYASLVNALLEEYVWRWFVFRRFEGLVKPIAAVVHCAAAFTLHHVFALSVYFDWRITLIGSAGVFIGGVTWSALYLRYRNVWSPWVSHLIADAAIFWIGWELIFG